MILAFHRERIIMVAFHLQRLQRSARTPFQKTVLAFSPLDSGAALKLGLNLDSGTVAQSRPHPCLCVVYKSQNKGKICFVPLRIAQLRTCRHGSRHAEAIIASHLLDHRTGRLLLEISVTRRAVHLPCVRHRFYHSPITSCYLKDKFSRSNETSEDDLLLTKQAERGNPERLPNHLFHCGALIRRISQLNPARPMVIQRLTYLNIFPERIGNGF